MVEVSAGMQGGTVLLGKQGDHATRTTPLPYTTTTTATPTTSWLAVASPFLK